MIGSYGTLFFVGINKIVPKNSLLLIVLLIGGSVGSILIFYCINHGNKICTINDEYLVIDKIKINWNEIKSYIIKDDSPIFKTLKIKNKNGKTISIGHRKKNAMKDDFEVFLKSFENKIIILNEKNYGIIKTPHFYATKQGKWYGYFLIVFLIIYTVVIINNFKFKYFANYLIIVFIALPILIQIFSLRIRRK